MSGCSVDRIMRVLRTMGIGSPVQTQMNQDSGSDATTAGEASLLPFFRHKNHSLSGSLNLQYKHPISRELYLLLTQALSGNKQAMEQLAKQIIHGSIIGPELKNCFRMLANEANQGNVPALKVINIVRYRADQKICQSLMHEIKDVCLRKGSFRALREWQNSPAIQQQEENVVIPQRTNR